MAAPKIDPTFDGTIYMRRPVETGNDEIVVSAMTYRDIDYVDIRRFYLAENGDMKPGRQGIRLPAAVVPNLQTALGSAIDPAQEPPLILTTS